MGMIKLEHLNAGAVALVTLDNPANHNMLKRSFWSEFTALLASGSTRGVRCLVLTGSGDRAFCAGGDLVSFSKLKGYRDRYAYMTECIGTFESMERSDIIIISAVKGLALGGGCELALASDFVIAADDAEFALPEANFGLMPSYGAFRGAEVLGRQRIKHMICGGARLSGRDAARLGLAVESAPCAEVLERALALARAIADKAPLAVKACKRVVNRDIDSGAFAHAIDLVTELQGTDDVAEGLAAFVQKRDPIFTGR